MKRVRRKRPRAGDVERGRGNGGCFCGEFIVDGELCRLAGGWVAELPVFIIHTCDERALGRGADQGARVPRGPVSKRVNAW